MVCLNVWRVRFSKTAHPCNRQCWSVCFLGGGQKKKKKKKAIKYLLFIWQEQIKADFQKFRNVYLLAIMLEEY